MGTDKIKVNVFSSRHQYEQDEKIEVSIMVQNDSLELVRISKPDLIGPNIESEDWIGVPYPQSVEATLPLERDNYVTLNSGCFYGRTRTYMLLPKGKVMVTGSLKQKDGSVITAIPVFFEII